MSFVAEFNSLPLKALVQQSLASSTIAARAAVNRGKFSIADFAALIPENGGALKSATTMDMQINTALSGKTADGQAISVHSDNHVHHEAEITPLKAQ